MGSGLRFIKTTFTATAGAYAAGQSVGVTMSLKNFFTKPMGVAVIRSLQLYDPAKQAVAFDLFFAGSREGFVVADKAAFDITAAALTLGNSGSPCGVVPFATTDIFATSTWSVATKSGLYLPVRGVKNGGATATANDNSDMDGRSLAVAMVSRGTPTYGAVALTLIVGLSD